MDLRNNTPITAYSSGNVAAATATATIAAVAGKTTYITGFSWSGGGATAASAVNLTVTGALGGTQTYTVGGPAGAGGVPPLNIFFDPAIPATAVNSTIVVSCPTLGAGNTNSTVVAWGYQI